MLDLLLVNCRPFAIGIRGGRIASVGDDTQAASRRLDLGGRTVVAGFNDAHAHVWKIGHLLTTMVDLRKVRSLDELEQRTRAAAAQLAPGAWLLGRGYNEAALREGRAPTRHDLDRAVPDRPVALTRTCGHISAANTMALRAAGIGTTTPAPSGGVIDRDERGEPTGLLHETAVGLLTAAIPPPTSAEHEAMIDAAITHQLSLGITSTSDCGVRPELLSVYRSMDANGALKARVNVMPLRRPDGSSAPLPLPQQHVSNMLRVDTVKFLADGGLSGATAAISVPYRHASSTGVLRFETAELLELAREAHDGGWRIATHAIGDVAIDQVLGVYERLGAHPRGYGHRIEHLGLPGADQLRRAVRLGVIAAPQAVFIHSLGRNFRQYLPDSLLPRCYPLRAMLDAGLCVALSSDAPVIEDDNPLLGIMAAHTRRDSDGETIAPEQAISVEEALRAYTMGGATATGDEGNRGTLDIDKWADLAVLSTDPRAVSPEMLPDVRVDMTLVAGEVVYER
jgi:predicted amidohydrolase YtcJ